MTRYIVMAAIICSIIALVLVPIFPDNARLLGLSAGILGIILIGVLIWTDRQR